MTEHEPPPVLRPGFTMYAAEADQMKRSHCRFCGRELTPYQALSTGICGAPDCHAKMIEKVGAEFLAQRREAFEERMVGVLAQAESEVEAALADLDSPREQVSVAVIPWQDQPVEPLPPERRAAFRAHLEEMAAIAFADPPPEDDLTVREADETDEPDVVRGTCGTCQGRCCRLGGDTALLVPSDLARYRQRNPEATVEEVIEVYLSYLPTASTRGACVYQATAGCSLPRALRQSICNSYYCGSLRWLNRDYRERRTGKVVFVAADEDDIPKRVAAIDPERGYRPVAEVPSGHGGEDAPGVEG